METLDEENTVESIIDHLDGFGSHMTVTVRDLVSGCRWNVGEIVTTEHDGVTVVTIELGGRIQ